MPTNPGDPRDNGSPRPPEGDWLGTPYLSGDLGGGGADNWMQWGSALLDTLRKSAKPAVAAVNGLCQGGGLQIAMCSNVAVVSGRATFRVPGLYRGIADAHPALRVDGRL